MYLRQLTYAVGDLIGNCSSASLSTAWSIFSLTVDDPSSGFDQKVILSNGEELELMCTWQRWTPWENPTGSDLVCNSRGVTVSLSFKTHQVVWYCKGKNERFLKERSLSQHSALVSIVHGDHTNTYLSLDVISLYIHR